MRKRILLLIPVIAAFIICFTTVQVVHAGGGDTTAPKINWVKVVNPEVTKPGIVSIDINITEEGLGVKSIIAGVCTADSPTGGYYTNSLEDVSFFSGTIRINIPIPSTAREGQYRVNEITIADYAGNTVYAVASSYYDETIREYVPGFYYDLNDQASVHPVLYLNITDEFNLGFETSLSYPNLISRINALNDGEYGKIFIDNKSNGIVPSAAFASISNKNVGLILYDDSCQWIFEGKDITNPKDVNVITTIENASGRLYSNSKKIVKIKFADNGMLPGKARIRMKSDYLYSLKNIQGTLKLYSLSHDRNTVTQESNPNFDLVFDGTNKWCFFDITHNSTFVISSGDLKSIPKIAIPKGKTLTYTGKPQTGVAKGDEYILSGTAKATNAGSYTAKATLYRNEEHVCIWTDGTTSAKAIKWTINKAANPLKVRGKTAKLKAKDVKKKSQTFASTKVIKFTKKGKGKMSYSKVSGNKKISINKTTGKVTVKKKLKKGTYKVKVKVKAKGNTNYKASTWKTVSFKITIK